MKTALVMGGTAFQGKRLVEKLLEEKCDVTIATRGKNPDPFGNRVKRIKFDRTDIFSMREAFGSSRFDIVYDQIAYGPDEIADACEIFNGKIGFYVFTSSSSVYGGGHDITEDEFKPEEQPLPEGRTGPLPYAEGKQVAEAYLAQRAPFPVAMARLPIIIGPDDISNRFQNHVRAVLTSETIIIPPPYGRWNFAEVTDAGRFIAWLGLEGKTGPYNGASSYALDAKEMVNRIGKILGKEPVVLDTGEGYMSEYAYSYDKILIADKAEREGFKFTDFEKWFPPVTKQTAAAISK